MRVWQQGREMMERAGIAMARVQHHFKRYHLPPEAMERVEPTGERTWWYAREIGGGEYQVVGMIPRRCWDGYADHEGEVERRPTLEGGRQMLCAGHWRDYEDAVYRSWQSHAG